MDNIGERSIGDARSGEPARASATARLTLLAELQEEFADTITEVDPRTPVPWCGDWTVADLVEHLIYIHRWAAAMARSDHFPDRHGSGARPDQGALRVAYQAAATELQATLAGLDPDAPARTLIDGGTVAFWHRRQVHETLVHLWDLRTAARLELTVDPGLWADTVDEALTVMHPRQVRLGRATAAPVRLAVVATDVDRSWELPGGQPGADGPPATVSGPAEALALLVWGRTDLDDPRLGVEGAADVLQTVLADHFLP